MNILALGAHPDDIEFGCGATLLKFARAGHRIFLYIATYGELGGDRSVRKQEQIDAAAFIGAEKVFWGEFPDCELPMSRHLITKIEDVIKEVTPDFTFVHYKEDTHQDHRALSTTTLSATRYVPNVLCYEGPSTLNFNPSVYMDVEGLLDDKKRLLEKHASQMQRVHVDMPEISIIDIAYSSARFRGIQARKKIAEAFESVRLFIDIPKQCDPAQSSIRSR